MLLVIALSLVGATVTEESYDFLAVTDGPCIPKIGLGIDPKHRAECERMSDLRRYRGIWQVEFEGSFFTPVGRPDCVETRGHCAQLIGKALPWPGRWECARKFEVEFVGRRNLLPMFDPAYTIVVDQLISAKRLADPYDDNCDPERHPELKTNN